jgi:hypothetical protein
MGLDTNHLLDQQTLFMRTLRLIVSPTIPVLLEARHRIPQPGRLGQDALSLSDSVGRL